MGGDCSLCAMDNHYGTKLPGGRRQSRRRGDNRISRASRRAGEEGTGKATRKSPTPFDAAESNCAGRRGRSAEDFAEDRRLSPARSMKRKNAAPEQRSEIVRPSPEEVLGYLPANVAKWLASGRQPTATACESPLSWRSTAQGNAVSILWSARPVCSSVSLSQRRAGQSP